MAGPAPAPGAVPELDRLRRDVAAYFPVYDTRITAYSVVFLVQVDLAELEGRFDRMRQEFWARGYVPAIRHERGEYVVEVVRRPNRKVRSLAGLTNVVLLALTLVTTVSAGAFIWLAYAGATALSATDFLYGGVYFALPLMAILGLHEFAHFVLARRHHVEASLPYFIPVPPPFVLFGTFGAFISLREPIPDRKALLDIGAAGPIAGFLVAVPITLAGLYLSAHTAPPPLTACVPSFLGGNYGSFAIGPSRVWVGLSLFFPVGAFGSLHPLALAGWVGLLVTAINLLPAGQLDGGHVFRALFGERSRYASWAAFGLLLVLTLFYPGWLLFALLIFFLGIRHPPPLNDLVRLDAKRWAVGALAVGILVSGFVIQPIITPTGEFAGTVGTVGHPPLAPGQAMADTVNLTIQNRDTLPHGYLLSGTVRSVIAATPGGTQPLTGANLTAFLANSTWTVQLPNGTLLATAGSGELRLPSTIYVALAAGDSATYRIGYANSAQATVDIELTVSLVCAGSFGAAAQQFAFAAS